MVEGAKHAACTVEMASVSRQVDVAVVDEIQMVADPSRGHSFTRAILGIPAHTCTSAGTLPPCPCCGSSSRIQVLCQCQSLITAHSWETELPCIERSRSATSSQSVARRTGVACTRDL